MQFMYTHFIEQVKTLSTGKIVNMPAHAIEDIAMYLEATKEYSDLKTIAVFKLKLKQFGTQKSISKHHR